MGDSSRTLKVKCPTWDHVENFYRQKVKEGRRLSARVPFNPSIGSPITIALELPNEMVVAIDAVVREAAPAEGETRASVRMELEGLTDELLRRLEALVADGRAEADVAAPAPAPEPPPGVSPPPRDPAEEPPAPLPTDAPVDERIEPPKMPSAAEVRADVKDIFLDLDHELQALRESAAHEVLGVKWDAGVADIRAAYFGLTKRYHPDVYARYGSSAIRHLASEVFICINKAYDRMRDAAVAAGSAIVAGPALLPHQGWLAGFEDIGTLRPNPVTPQEVEDAVRERRARGGEAVKEAERAGKVTVKFQKPAKAAPPPDASPGPEQPLTEEGLFGDIDLGGGGEGPAAELANEVEGDGEAGAGEPKALEVGRRLLGEQRYEDARRLLADALRDDPRNRELRALYHVAFGFELMSGDKSVDATSQFEAALAHDPECEEAKRALEQTKQAGGAKKGLFRRLLSR